VGTKDGGVALLRSDGSEACGREIELESTESMYMSGGERRILNWNSTEKKGGRTGGYQGGCRHGPSGTNRAIVLTSLVWRACGNVQRRLDADEEDARAEKMEHEERVWVQDDELAVCCWDTLMWWRGTNRERRARAAAGA
jgi:hypothetical protein